MEPRLASNVRTFSSSTGYASLASATSDLQRVEEEYHVHRRWFIGPMPEKVAIPVEDATRKRDIAHFVKEHALSFFLQEGGKMEDWGETEELSTREEMLHKWRESEWGAVLSRRKDVKDTLQTHRWVGNSFEVGKFLGVNVLAAQSTEAIMSGVSSRKGLSELHLPSLFGQVESLSTPHHESTPSISSLPRESASTRREGTFMTARTEFEPTLASSSKPSEYASLGIPYRSSSPTPEEPQPGPSTTYQNSITDELAVDDSAHSTTELIQRPSPALHTSSSSKARSEVTRRPIIKKPSVANSDGAMLHVDKGKHKVHYADKPALSPIPDPAPVAEVLQRSGEDVQDTSAGAMSTDAAGVNTRTVDWGQVVLRDRMLVRVSYSKSEALGLHFDEYQNRMTSGLQYEDWAEFMVVWRRDKIELYEDYSTPGKERLTGHKHLAFVVPLKSGRTRLSMYSFIDMTFCITCPPTPTTAQSRTASKSRGLFHISKQGTNIFVFKVKTRSRALDWIWQLWRHIGGQLPEIIEVRNPTLDTIVKIEVPNITTVENDKMFTRSNIIRLCIESLHNVSDWKDIVERQVNGGKVLELAWRIDTNLEWIWLETDMYGMERPWTVLCGLALRQAHLEIRLGDHYPNKVPNPKKADEENPFITEPPSIEGYVERIKPLSQTKQRVYMVTHDGNLFLLQLPKAHPPSPFLSDEDEPSVETHTPLRDREVTRGVSQIMDAFGVADLRSILVVRRANAPVPAQQHTERAPKTDQDWANVWTVHAAPPEEGDYDDEGGEESLNRHEDKQHLRMRRSFELLLTSGHVIRFECHSCKHALEWIERLRALIAYWTLRHKCDAKEEMEVSSARRPRLTPRHHIHVLDEDLPPFPPPDPAAPLPALSNMYNWCVLQGCKPIIRGGKVHMRRGLHGQYKMAQMFLIAGHLVMFRIKPTTALHLTMKKRISLADAYICSGYFAALALPRGQYDPEVNSAPRHYQDGLETDDPEEDMLFMVWYHKTTKGAEGSEVRALSAKRKLVVFRTRSKLERDSWCWALNTEIERISRGQRGREAVLRDTGALMKLGSF